MKWVSMLRGINVSGQKKVKMADLAALYESLGFTDVSTYIQSGNVVFSAGRAGRAKLQERIESAIAERFGFEAPVQLRTHDELRQAIDQCPFGPVDLPTQGTKVLVTFLARQPAARQVKDIAAHVKAPEALVVRGTEAYVHCPNGYGRSKLTNAFLEARLGVSATTRNFKSVVKLCELSA